MITQNRLKELVHYEPETGNFYARVKRGNVNPSDRPMPNKPNDSGYIRMRVDGKSYRAHRLAWLYMTGKLPLDKIDHIDNNPSNNHWENLREATNQQNMCNSGIRSNNTSGHKNISILKNKRRTLQVRVMKDYKYTSKTFQNTPEGLLQALAWRDEKLVSLHKEYANNGTTSIR